MLLFTALQDLPTGYPQATNVKQEREVIDLATAMQTSADPLPVQRRAPAGPSWQNEGHQQGAMDFARTQIAAAAAAAEVRCHTLNRCRVLMIIMMFNIAQCATTYAAMGWAAVVACTAVRYNSMLTNREHWTLHDPSCCCCCCYYC